MPRIILSRSKSRMHLGELHGFTSLQSNNEYTEQPNGSEEQDNTCNHGPCRSKWLRVVFPNKHGACKNLIKPKALHPVVHGGSAIG